ncbi:S-adenosyl-L-methionine-dependent methyltransferase [Naematelia encephala]|uniref:tRNA (uracil(54)-C(5))-methyltransferase n=1 Tax=Naematelia encephala TaxID=71784 RepID=A0A1Y2B5X5_9TREE|nr:S-adenosyl-L-methionine-dependent methyltransferase [Naematelia encephala]
MSLARAITSFIHQSRVYIRAMAATAPHSIPQRSPPAHSPSPPPKRARAEPEPEAGPSTLISVTQAPVNALYVPPVNGNNTKGGKGKGKGKKIKLRRTIPEAYSPADVLWRDVQDFLGKEYTEKVLASERDEEWTPPDGLELQTILELRVGAFTVSGESLSLYERGGKKWAVVTPFAHPGDLIRARVYRQDRLVSHADLVEIIEYSETYRGGPGDRRKHPEGGCKYFGECGGCQLQPLPYEKQLEHKKRTVVLAYERFSGLARHEWPDVRDTIGSPKQWGYRTKITPHFEAPPKWARPKVPPPTKAAVLGEEEILNQSVEEVEQGEKGNGHIENEGEQTEKRTFECRIGFERKGRPGVMDIEECPIATPIINSKLTEERVRIKSTIMNYTKGATLLLRDSLPEPELPFSASSPTMTDSDHIAITNHRAFVFERVGDHLFQFAAGSFFQNNNSILIPLTTYVKEAIFPPSQIQTLKRPTHLVDAYCGSGLFGITLSTEFEKVAGVEISLDSIKAAKRNAEINGLEDKTEWLCGKAEEIFAGLPAAGFEGNKSCVIVDPPRKGCDEQFLAQLLDFKPLSIVYVSCNVHTQARDIGWFVKESRMRGNEYQVESIRGFDLFPQTAHVESVAVLRLK